MSVLRQRGCRALLASFRSHGASRISALDSLSQTPTAPDLVPSSPNPAHVSFRGAGVGLPRGGREATAGLGSQLLFRGFSTHVGHGSGGRERGHTLHEPPESHPFAVKGLNHIALAVPNLLEASEHYRTVFGAQVSDPHPVADHGVTVVFVHIGSTTIELLEPLGDNSPIAKFLERHPRGGIHHLCFTVDNIEVASQHVTDEGVRVLGDYVEGQAAKAGDTVAGEYAGSKVKLGAHGNPVVFLDPRDNLGVLCELEQVFCHER